MSRPRAFFLEEAGQCLDALRGSARGGAGAAAMHAAARRLRGSAQMARYGGVADLAGALEARLRPVARGEVEWSRETAASVTAAIASLDGAVAGVRSGGTQPDARMVEAMTENMEGDAATVAIEELEYSARAALERALELRPALEDAVVAEQPVGPIMDELFDLVRLGMK